MAYQNASVKCAKCGLCCRHIVTVGKTLYYSERYCRFLDQETKLCTVYEMRFKMRKGCSPIGEAIMKRLAPSQCAYVKNIAGYTPVVVDIG